MSKYINNINNKISNNILYNKNMTKERYKLLINNNNGNNRLFCENEFNNITYDISNVIIEDIELLYKDNIYIFNDAIDDIICKELIDKIDKCIENGTEMEENYKKGRNVQCKFINIERNSKENNIIKNIIMKYSKIVDKIFYIKTGRGSNINKNIDSGYCLRKIYGSTRRHSDGPQVTFNKKNNTHSYRTLTVIISLSDFEGGNMKFPLQNITH